MLDVLFPYLAWLVCLALFTVPVVWGGVFTLALLGHLTQFLFKKESLIVERN
ncbi:hypothetical protein KKI24_16105 [bacterium]|nr:hypothetical protein [bacterium]